MMKFLVYVASKLAIHMSRKMKIASFRLGILGKDQILLEEIEQLVSQRVVLYCPNMVRVGMGQISPFMTMGVLRQTEEGAFYIVLPTPGSTNSAVYVQFSKRDVYGLGEIEDIPTVLLNWEYVEAGIHDRETDD